MFYKYFMENILVLSFFVSASTAVIQGRGAIGFPEVEENVNLANKQNRQPVFLPAMCPENELYYPGDQEDDWICDCRPGYLFYPASNSCWPAYQRGPCQDGQYLVLPTDSITPTCYINPCKVDKFVLWNGKCEALGSTEACDSNVFPPNVLWVNATNMLIDCIRVTMDSTATVRAPPACPPGCKRNIQNKCVAPPRY